MAIHTFSKDNTAEDLAAYPQKPLKMDVAYEGCVLDKVEVNGANDSDFLAVVWDDEEGTVKRIQYATTRGWTYPNHADIDATEEVWAKAIAWAMPRAVETVRQREAKRLTEVRKGCIVRTTRKLKHAPRGAEGEAFWRDGSRFGVKTPSGDVFFVNETSLEVVKQPDSVPPARTEENIQKEAERLAPSIAIGRFLSY